MTTLAVSPVLRGRKLLVTLVLAAVTVALVVAQVAVHSGSSNSSPAVTGTGYAKAISSLSPERLSAAFGTSQPAPAATFGNAAPAIGSAGNVFVKSAGNSYVKGIASLTRAEQAAAFGGATPAVDSGVRNYAERIARLDPHRRAAAFGFTEYTR